MMDLGATVCTSRRPACDACPLAALCAARAAGTPETFPVKPPKRARPTKLGTVFWLEAAGAVLLVTRPPRGLLGGMIALPTGPWETDHPGLAGAPADVEWRVRPAAVRHGFTHFELVLDLAVARLPLAPPVGDPGARWAPVAELADAGLPTLFRRAAEAAMARDLFT
jgi:A/G-specific adenine glycosylase